MASHHPLQQKLCVIRTLTHRAESLFTEQDDPKSQNWKTSRLPYAISDINGHILLSWIQTPACQQLKQQFTTTQRLHHTSLHPRCVWGPLTHSHQARCSSSLRTKGTLYVNYWSHPRTKSTSKISRCCVPDRLCELQCIVRTLVMLMKPNATLEYGRAGASEHFWEGPTQQVFCQ